MALQISQNSWFQEEIKGKRLFFFFCLQECADTRITSHLNDA